MRVLVAYDVATAGAAGARRLRRVARACQDYGRRVQKSVFECEVGAAEWVAMRARLLGEIDPRRDSLRFYFLDADVRVEHHGSNRPRDVGEGLIV